MIETTQKTILLLPKPSLTLAFIQAYNDHFSCAFKSQPGPALLALTSFNQQPTGLWLTESQYFNV